MSPLRDVAAHALDPALVRRRARRSSGRREGRPRRRRGSPSASVVRRRGASSRAWTSSSRRASRRASPSSARPPSQAWPVRRSQATTQSWRASRSGGRPWSSGGDGRQPLEGVAEVVAEEPDEPAEEARRIGRHDRRRVEAGQQPAGDRERVRAGGRRLEDRDRVGGQVRPARVAAGPGALEDGQPGQVAERLGGVDGAGGGDAVGQAAQADRRRPCPCVRAGRGRRGSSRPMIRPTPRDRPDAAERRPLPSVDACSRPGDHHRAGRPPARTTPSPTSPA